MRLFCDMDGVLVDFVGGASKLFHYDPCIIDRWGYFPLIGVTEQQFWDRIKGVGSRFWYDLPAYSYHDDVMQVCGEFDPEFQILTKPGREDVGPSSAKGKIAWLHKMYGTHFDRYFVGAHKHRCAGPDAVLIDDVEKNCEAFRAHGGHAILFPQQYNENRKIKDPVRYLRQQLEAVQTAIDAPGGMR